jgi:hypothetical protein
MFTDRKTVSFLFLKKKIKIKIYVHLLRMKINFFIEKIKNPSTFTTIFYKKSKP